MTGITIGNYRITDLLARSAVSEIYRGYHLHLPREVVVKSILYSDLTPSALAHLKARFRREAYIQAQLDHPNIVRVYEFFVQDENYYLVMEYVSGSSLTELLELHGAPTQAQAVSLCKQALAALNYAHKFTYVDESENIHTGIIHRDIKPANFLLDNKGRLKITDFGIVKITGDESLTQNGFQPGTVDYMSPEQFLGLNVDERSDIYCLGVTLYELLTGILPFPRSSTGSDWVVRKGHVEVKPPSIREVRPDLHPALDAIVMRALQKNPSDRFQSAEEFLEALRVFEYMNNGSKTQRAGSTTVRQNVLSTPMGINSSPARLSPILDEAFVPAAIDYPVERLRNGQLNQSFSFLENGTKRSEGQGQSGRSARKEIHSLMFFLAGHPDFLQNRNWRFFAYAILLLLLVTAGWAYFFSDNRKNGEVLKNVSNNLVQDSQPSPISTGNLNPEASLRVINHSVLLQARTYEQLERYPDAIMKFEEYLRQGPDRSEARLIWEKLNTLRQFQKSIASADQAMDKKAFKNAIDHYLEALKLMPDSALARAGFVEAKSKVSGKGF
ncbi:MAG: serine/threonine protein kinase [Acidobacteria bacterium]|nr:serine/threonine protein kinase [Acidobacteriota bacterium]